MAKKDRTDNRKLREQRKQFKVPELCCQGIYKMQCRCRDFTEFIVLVRISETTNGIVLLVNFIQKEYYSFRRLCYFSIDSKNISDYKFTVGNQILKPVKKDGKYYVDFA